MKQSQNGLIWIGKCQNGTFHMRTFLNIWGGGEGGREGEWSHFSVFTLNLRQKQCSDFLTCSVKHLHLSLKSAEVSIRNYDYDNNKALPSAGVCSQAVGWRMLSLLYHALLGSVLPSYRPRTAHVLSLNTGRGCKGASYHVPAGLVWQSIHREARQEHLCYLLCRLVAWEVEHMQGWGMFSAEITGCCGSPKGLAGCVHHHRAPSYWHCSDCNKHRAKLFLRKKPPWCGKAVSWTRQETWLAQTS